jgi:hypothetical protein
LAEDELPQSQGESDLLNANLTFPIIASFSAWMRLSLSNFEFELLCGKKHLESEDVVFKLLPRFPERGMIVIQNESEAVIELLLGSGPFSNLGTSGC